MVFCQASSMDIFAELQCTSPAFDVAWSNSSAGVVATAATNGDEGSCWS